MDGDVVYDGGGWTCPRDGTRVLRQNMVVKVEGREVVLCPICDDWVESGK